MSIGIAAKHSLRVRAWTPGQQPTAPGCCTTQSEQPVSPLTDGTSAPMRTWPLRVLARTTNWWTDVLGKFPRSQHRPLLITPSRLKVPAYSDPVKHWKFRKAYWKRFCLLAGESVERLPPPNSTKTEKVYQAFFESLLFAAKQCIPRGRRKNCAPCWDKGCESLHRSFLRAPARTNFDRAALSQQYFLGSNRRSRSDGKKLSIPSTSRTPATRRGAPSINLLSGLDAPLTCAPSLQSLSPHNSWRTGHTRLRVMNPSDSSTSSCPTYGRPQHLSETVYLALPEELAAALRRLKPESLRIWILSSRSLYSMLVRLSNLSFAISSLPACANSKF